MTEPWGFLIQEHVAHSAYVSSAPLVTLNRGRVVSPDRPRYPRGALQESGSGVMSPGLLLLNWLLIWLLMLRGTPMPLSPFLFSRPRRCEATGHPNKGANEPSPEARGNGPTAAHAAPLRDGRLLPSTTNLTGGSTVTTNR